MQYQQTMAVAEVLGVIMAREYQRHALNTYKLPSGNPSGLPRKLIIS